MKKYILEEIDRMKEEDHVSFHTPGHKGRNTLIDWKDYMPFGDLTELGNLDNLHNPRGIILKSQENMSRIYGSRETFYLVNGTTGGIYIGIAALTRPGDRVLIQRNSHKSVYNACILNRLRLDYIEPNIYKGIPTDLDPEEIDTRLREDPSIGLVVVSSPNYYGIGLDMKRIVEIVRKHGRQLLVDEAHGSHLRFSDRLPKSSLDFGADIVVQSSHKSLPSLTQSSMLHIGSDRVDIDRVREFSRIYQTTSPSYLFLLSLELAGNYMLEEGYKELDRNIDIVEDWTLEMEKYGDIDIFSMEGRDITKILFSVDGYTGPELEKIFMEDGIYLEMSEERYALALSTVMNTREDFDRLFSKIISLSGTRTGTQSSMEMELNYSYKKEYEIYDAFYRDYERLSLDESLNRVAKSFVIPYPPGVPILVPGELISPSIVKTIRELMDLGIELVGVCEDALIDVIL